MVKLESVVRKSFPNGHLVGCVRAAVYEQLTLKAIPEVSVVVEI